MLSAPRLHHHIDGFAEARAVLRNELFRQRRRILLGHGDGSVQPQILHAGQVAERPQNRDFRRPCARKQNQTQLPPVQAHWRGGFKCSERVGQRSASCGKCLIAAVLLVCRDAHADGAFLRAAINQQGDAEGAFLRRQRRAARAEKANQQQTKRAFHAFFLLQSRAMVSTRSSSTPGTSDHAVRAVRTRQSRLMSNSCVSVSKPISA